MNTSADATLAGLWRRSVGDGQRDLAYRYAPVIRFDDREPFMPLAAGYTIFHADGPSPSFRQGRQIVLAPGVERQAATAIEYAIWWDWDIGHLYELEHVWVYVDEGGAVVRVEASWHGGQHNMRLGGALALEGDCPVVYSEPGKHAFAPTPAWFAERRKRFKRSETRELAGASGVLMAPYIQGQVKRTPLHNLLVRSYLAARAFEPSLDFSRYFRFEPQMLVPWPALRSWMPGRINHVLDRLRRELAPGDYRFLRIGHRGAAAHAPHNSLAGIRLAAQLGADMVEIDVQRTADGQVVLCHDDHLVDGQGRVLLVRKNTLEALRTVDLGDGERVPTLAEAIKTCREEMLGTYIEIKDGGVLPALAVAIKDCRLHQFCIAGSFRADWVADLKAAVPEMPTSILFSAKDLDAVGLAQSINASYVHPCWERYPDPAGLVSPAWMERARQADLGVVCWHEERPEVIAALADRGVDGICGDEPEVLKQVWDERAREQRGAAWLSDQTS